MTSRELYEYALIELNKVEAPSLILEDYNYFINKAVQQYINLVYQKLEIDQQSTDDIRVLKTSTVLTPTKMKDVIGNNLFKSSYSVTLPEDYMHLLNCIVEYEVSAPVFKCYNKGDSVYFPCRRLTPDMYTQVLNNAYMRPMYKRPYYYLNNVNSTTALPTNSAMDSKILSANGIDNVSTDTDNVSTDTKTAYATALTNYANALKANDGTSEKKTALEKAEKALASAKKAWDAEVKKTLPTSNLVDAYTPQGDRLANPSSVRLELRYGNDDSVFIPKNLYIDYLKAPMYIRLTQEQIDSTLDYSQVLEFPDYVCFEIANIFVRLLMENASDPRLQTNIPINKTIATPGVEQNKS